MKAFHFKHLKVRNASRFALSTPKKALNIVKDFGHYCNTNELQPFV